MSATAPTRRVIGLRFKASEAPKLRALVDRVKANDLLGDVTTYEQAAIAAEQGEPLQVHFNEPEEVLGMVAGYVLQGIAQPAIDELNGSFGR